MSTFAPCGLPITANKKAHIPKIWQKTPQPDSIPTILEIRGLVISIRIIWEMCNPTPQDIDEEDSD